MWMLSDTKVNMVIGCKDSCKPIFAEDSYTFQCWSHLGVNKLFVNVVNYTIDTLWQRTRKLISGLEGNEKYCCEKVKTFGMSLGAKTKINKFSSIENEPSKLCTRRLKVVYLNKWNWSPSPHCIRGLKDLFKYKTFCQLSSHAVEYS